MPRVARFLMLGVLVLAGCEVDDDDETQMRCGPNGDGDGAPGDGAVLTGEGWGGGGAPIACNPATGGFTLEIDNPYFPLSVGSLRVMEGQEDGALLRVEVRVLDETEEVAGVTTRVVEETEYEDDELIEVSRNWFVQASDGSVCYFGEEVDIYAGGEIVAHEGAWRAGENGAMAGIVMPGDPQLGMSYPQEVAPADDAWDHASHVAADVTISVPAGEYEGSIRTLEWTPIEPDEVSRKAYAPGVGMIVDNTVQLVSYEE